MAGNLSFSCPANAVASRQDPCTGASVNCESAAIPSSFLLSIVQSPSKGSKYRREVVRDGLAAARIPLTPTLGGACVSLGK